MCCFWCWRRKVLLDFLYVFCDVASQGVEFLEDEVHDAVLHGRLQSLEKSSLWLSTLEDVEAGRCSFLFTLRRFFGQTA
jgi:hypothetical protein